MAKRPMRPTGGPIRRKRWPAEELARISYLDPEYLKQFLTSRGRIRSRRQTGLPRRDQARMAREIKRARELALIPYVIPEAESSRGGRGGRRRSRDDD
jgi:small subunit ribosomal protein S18